MSILIGLLDGWQNWTHRNGPTRREVRQAQNSRGHIPWNDAGNRAAFRVDAQRRLQREILAEQTRPRLVGGCGTPGCDGRCGR